MGLGAPNATDLDLCRSANRSFCAATFGLVAFHVIPQGGQVCAAVADHPGIIDRSNEAHIPGARKEMPDRSSKASWPVSEFSDQGLGGTPMATKLAPELITPAQCRAARGLLGWTLSRLSKTSTVSVGTINKFELERRHPVLSNLAALKRSLEAGGVDFIPAHGKKGPGVRLASHAERRPFRPDALCEGRTRKAIPLAQR